MKELRKDTAVTLLCDGGVTLSRVEWVRDGSFRATCGGVNRDLADEGITWLRRWATPDSPRVKAARSALALRDKPEFLGKVPSGTLSPAMAFLGGLTGTLIADLIKDKK